MKAPGFQTNTIIACVLFEAEMLLPLVRRLHQCVSFLLLSRLDGEDDREPGEVQHSHTEPDSSPPVEGHGDNNASTKADEPNASQPSQTDCERHMEET